MRLEAGAYDAAHAHLTGADALPLIRFMASQSVALPDTSGAQEAKAIACDLGWFDAHSGRPTIIGTLISDSCREYLFWLERERALPFEGALPHLERDTFAGKSVTEIGAGMGANLMSLSGTAKSLRGIEPIEVYAQMGCIFRAREGLPDFDVHIGGAEAIPLPDGSQELVLCVTAHQYFDIHKALPELARILRPGGALIVIGGTLGGYAAVQGRNVLRSGGRGAKAYAVTLFNTLAYQATGQRALPNRGVFSTSRPIYPTTRAMTRWLQATGFDTLAPPQPAAGEYCFYVRRRGQDA
jgi:SAM-dependent methyltransferase